ncbi:trypsin alpha-3-like [Lutzomyia longipalpis]|uniref:trypsin alpha-3-like n=1 Tax=Lutzomyia longipalpis TaxID=7200 RepID=UPI0024840D4A|nr:trypsin alpha-3-like [Lutzomyia longipalpis]
MFKFIILATLCTAALGREYPTPHDFIAGIKAAEEGLLPEVDSFIIGGSTASPGQFPYIASIRSAANAHFCGGILANNRWIVSAAHCTVGRTLANTISVLGAHSRTSGGTTFTSARIVNHPQYNANTIANDVCVIQTTNPITFTNLIQPIALGSAHVGGGVAAVVSGWGVTSFPGGSLAANLQFLNVQTITNAQCSQSVAGSGSLIFAHKICNAGIVGRGPCSSDSGGPLAAGNTAIGIVSWGIGCANGFADVYDRVSSHRNWIIGHF